jgi:hypothetical protein
MQQKRRCVSFIGTFIALFMLMANCSNDMAKEEALAKQYCGSCHLFPEPSLLTKELWETAVMPQMAFRMGLSRPKILYQVDYQDLQSIRQVIPKQPMITEADLAAIARYYEVQAPEKLDDEQQEVREVSAQFDAYPIDDFASDVITMMAYDSIHDRLMIGDARASIYSINKNMQVVDTTKIGSPPSHIWFEGDEYLVCGVGGLMPNDKVSGEIYRIDGTSQKVMLDSLRRPVYFHWEDMDQDGLRDFIVCSFGHYKGRLSIFQQQRDGSYVRHEISSTPGARKVVVTDWDHDGKKDIVALMAQGDERLIFLKNIGTMQYQEKILMRFPPIYGSSYFELADFNRDGAMDILYTNGDNGDYTNINKPYHAVRILENDKNGGLKEVWSYQMAGAWEANAADFDHDGDLDIAAISLFPNLKDYPNQSFLYFENKGALNFSPSIIPLTSDKKWMAIEIYDQDHDGDEDIVLGAFYFESLLNPIKPGSVKRGASLMVLRNAYIKSEGEGL